MGSLSKMTTLPRPPPLTPKPKIKAIPQQQQPPPPSPQSLLLPQPQAFVAVQVHDPSLPKPPKLDIQDKDVDKKHLLFKQYIKGIPSKKPLNQTEEKTLREINKKMNKEYGGRKFKPFWYSSQDCR